MSEFDEIKETDTTDTANANNTTIKYDNIFCVELKEEDIN